MTSKTINLTGTELAVTYAIDNYPYVWLRNDSTATVYGSSKGSVTAGSDGVVSIPVGQSACVYCTGDVVYLLGTGSVMLVASNTPECPFKTSAQAGGSGADDVARAAIEAHAGNADIHISAAEKATWDGKAELSDIPDKLPADGGNADTLGGHPASDFFQASVGLRKGTQPGDIFSNMSPTHAGWNNFCAIESESAIPNAPESAVPMRYEVWTCCENMARGYQIAVSLFTRKVYIRYLQDGAWSGWYNIADGGNAASVGTYTEAKIAALEARIAALEGGGT